MANNMFTSKSSAGRKKVAILLTDGRPTVDVADTEPAAKVRRHHLNIFNTCLAEECLT